MAIYSGFSHSKWWFSIAMLNYQRVLDWKKPGFRMFPVNLPLEIIPMIVNDCHICWLIGSQWSLDTNWHPHSTKAVWYFHENYASDHFKNSHVSENKPMEPVLLTTGSSCCGLPTTWTLPISWQLDVKATTSWHIEGHLDIAMRFMAVDKGKNFYASFLFFWIPSGYLT